jgi:hypothetical protein
MKRKVIFIYELSLLSDKMVKKVLILILFVLIFGCQDNQVSNNTIENKDEFVMPKNFETQTFEIGTNDGYNLEIATIESELSNETNYDRWVLYQTSYEEKAKYRNVRLMWEVENRENFPQLEQDRIEEYCKTYGLAYCMNIDKTCDDMGCYKVTVTCDDDSYDEGIDDLDECRRFEVYVEKEIDDDLTKEHEKEVLCR